ncbi:hypothetical protein [Prevotella sp. oral taxon 299]|uniref:hypothetical protein n=1 Tax=Prevotella sp. oral taxon 299 TaxID=652716 RepID=UPI0001C4077F|nr:hypothetical protein [Prevotella sp. oral taxon 299]EFC71320.1 hypothetical protein HMPREF0669_01025 [Prevotella sp. oral taxon 299 str. F0039]
MKTRDNSQTEVKSNQYKERSYYEWGCNLQVVRKGNGEIAMTESELARFFGVTWKKLNGRLKAIVHNPNLHPDERSAGESVMVRGNELAGYAPLYPFPIIIALSFHLDNTEAHFFRKYIIQELQRPKATITPIFLFGGTQH